MMEQVERFLAEHSDQRVEELKDFLRIASISAVSSAQPEMKRGAQFVCDQLTGAGLEAEVVETEGHPLVFGSWLGAPGAPTVLIYGHYDVQPPDPLEEWVTPPFEPEIRDGCIYARGATDDKGQLLTHIKSVEAWMKAAGRLPVNVKFVVEGEEEVGGSNLDRFLEENRERAQCDIAVISDTSQFAPGMPAITYSLRGMMACEVTVTGPSKDLHSGLFGGSVANPVNALCEMIGRLHDSEGRVQIPGFYDDVIELGEAERKALAALPFDEAAYFTEIGVAAGRGEAGFSTIERRWARPTCDVNGVIGGYTGEGPKTIVPARGSAKISCRLVPHQNPEKLLAALLQFLTESVPPGLRVEVSNGGGCEPVLVDTTSGYVKAAKAAIEKAFGTAPVMIREGGTIPVVATFREVLGVDTLLLGWGQSTDNLHSPNEHFSLADFHRGTQASAYLWNELASQSE